MAPLRSLGNIRSAFDDFYARTGKDAGSPWFANTRISERGIWWNKNYWWTTCHHCSWMEVSTESIRQLLVYNSWWNISYLMVDHLRMATWIVVGGACGGNWRTTNLVEVVEVVVVSSITIKQHLCSKVTIRWWWWIEVLLTLPNGGPLEVDGGKSSRWRTRNKELHLANFWSSMEVEQ